MAIALALALAPLFTCCVSMAILSAKTSEALRGGGDVGAPVWSVVTAHHDRTTHRHKVNT